jgi:type I restriction enzyme S subunit
VADIPLTTNQGFANFVPRSEIISRFLAYSLWYRREDIARLSGSTTFKEVSRSTFRKYQIPVPPLAEQERIVKLLDEADELRKLRAQADHCTAELIPAFFHKMFGDPACNSKRWPIVPASDLMILCEYGCSQKANEDSEGVPMLRMGNVTSVGLLDLTNLKHVLFNKDELAKYRLASGDVLFNRTNSRELVGKTGMWDGRFEAVAASYFIRIRFDPAREHPQHFTTFMNLPHMKQRLMEMARGAIGQSNINAQELKAIPIPVPPLPLQKEFAQRVMEIRELEASQAASRLRLEELFQSLLHRAFNGEL